MYPAGWPYVHSISEAPPGEGLHAYVLEYLMMLWGGVLVRLALIWLPAQPCPPFYT